MIIYIEQVCRNFSYRCKGLLFKMYLLLHGCKVGKGLKCIGYPNFRIIPNKNIVIGNNVALGRNVTFEISAKGKLTLGNNVLLSDNILLTTISEIRLDDWAAVAENVSIRGNFHEMKKESYFRLQGDVSLPIVLEEGTGIGAGCVVLMGVTVPKGAFIAANSTVIKNIDLAPNGIYGGVPLKLLKFRD